MLRAETARHVAVQRRESQTMSVLSLLLMFFFSISPLYVCAEESIEMLSLARAIAIALEHNPTLQAASASIDVMKARVQDTRSNLFPKIDARFIYPFVGTESGVSLNQFIWDFKRTQNLITASKEEMRSSEFDSIVNRDDLILRTKVAYYTVLIQTFMVGAGEKIVRENEKRLEQAESFLKVGRISKIDLAKIKIGLGNAKMNLINTKNSLEQAKVRLAIVMGIKGNLQYQLEFVPDYHKIEGNVEEWINTALDLRPELHSIEAKGSAMQANLLASKQDFYPKFFGRLEYRIEGEGAEQPGFIAGVGFRVSLFDGFSKSSKVKEAKANLLRSDADKESMKQQIESEVRQSYLNLQAGEESIQVTEISKISAGESLEFAKERYRLGRGSDIELAEAEALFAATTASYVQAIYNYKISVAQLERSIGKKIAE
jgi:outer membrane protein